MTPNRKARYLGYAVIVAGALGFLSGWHFGYPKHLVLGAGLVCFGTSLVIGPGIRGAGDQGASPRQQIMLGAVLTAAVGLFFTTGFLVHERPPTTGHLLAAAATLVPAVLLVLAVYAVRPAQQRDAVHVVVLQILATALILVPILDQNVARDTPYWLTTGVLFLGPVLVSLRGLIRLPPA